MPASSAPSKKKDCALKQEKKIAHHIAFLKYIDTNKQEPPCQDPQLLGPLMIFNIIFNIKTKPITEPHRLMAVSAASFTFSYNS